MVGDQNLRQRGRFVLVVDDDTAIRDSVREQLAVLGVPTIGATDGMQALEAVARLGVPGGVITDVHMPRLDGMGLIQELRGDREASSIPILLMSGDQLLDEVPQDVELASKPLTLATLESFIRRAGLPESRRMKVAADGDGASRPTVIVNPASDEVFAEFAGMLVDHGVSSIWEFEDRLRAVYPATIVHARQLDTAPWTVWYVHRDGPADSEGEQTRGEEQANVEHK